MITVLTGMLNQQLLPVGMDAVPYPSLAPAQHLSLPVQTLGVLSCASLPFWGALSSTAPLPPTPAVSSWLSPALQREFSPAQQEGIR